MSYIGAIVFFYGIIIVMAALTGAMAQGKSGETGAIVLGVAVILLLPVMFLISVGSMVRRARDAGQSPWIVLAMIVPCINFILIIYLLAAPGDPNATASSGGGASGIIVAVVAVFVGIAIIGIIAAIAIPSLLRARVSANEAATIGDIRTLISAQAVYQSMNGGFYESRVECLAEPGECIPNSTSPPSWGPNPGPDQERLRRASWSWAPRGRACPPACRGSA